MAASRFASVHKKGAGPHILWEEERLADELKTHPLPLPERINTEDTSAEWLERVRKEVATKALTYNEGKATQPVRLSTLQAMTKARFRNFLSNLGFPHISNVQADVLFDAYDRKGVGALTVDDVRQDVQPASSRTSFITWEQERLADYLKSNPPPPPPPRPSSRDTSEEWVAKMRKEVATKALTYNEGKPLQPFRMSTAKMMNRGRFRNFLSNLGFPNISNAQADALFAAYDRDKMGMVSVDAVRQDVVPASSRTTFITWQEEAHPPVPVIPTLPGFEPPVTARTSHLAPPLSRNVDPDKLAPVIIQDDRNVDEWVKRVRPLVDSRVMQYTPHTSVFTVLKRLQGVAGHGFMTKPDFKIFLAKMGFPNLKEPQLDALFASYSPSGSTGAVPGVPLDHMTNQIMDALTKPTQTPAWAEEGRVDATLSALAADGFSAAAAKLGPAMNKGILTAGKLFHLAERARVPKNTSETGAVLFPFHQPTLPDHEFKVDTTVDMIREKFLNKFGNDRFAMLMAIRGANTSVAMSARMRHIQELDQKGDVAAKNMIQGALQPAWMPPQRNWGVAIDVANMVQPGSTPSTGTHTPTPPSAPSAASMRMSQVRQAAARTSMTRLPADTLSDPWSVGLAFQRVCGDLGVNMTSSQVNQIMQQCMNKASPASNHSQVTTNDFLDALLGKDVDKDLVNMPTCQALRPSAVPQLTMREEKALPKAKTPRIDADMHPLTDKAGRTSARYVKSGDDAITRLRNFIAARVREKSKDDYMTVQFHRVMELFDDTRAGGAPPARRSTLNEAGFRKFVEDLGETNVTDAEMLALFQSYDRQGAGLISVPDMLHGLQIPDPKRNEPSHPGNSDPPVKDRRAGWGKDPLAAEEVVPVPDYKGRMLVDPVTVDDILRGINEKMCLKEPLERKAKAKFTKCCEFFDSKGNGTITEKALRKTLWQQGFGLPESHLQRLFASLNGSGPVGDRVFDYKLLAERMIEVGPDLRRRPRSPVAEETGKLMSIFDKQPPPPENTLQELIASSNNERLFTNHKNKGITLDLASVLNGTAPTAGSIVPLSARETSTIVSTTITSRQPSPVSVENVPAAGNASFPSQSLSYAAVAAVAATPAPPSKRSTVSFAVDQAEVVPPQATAAPSAAPQPLARTPRDTIPMPPPKPKPKTLVAPLALPTPTSSTPAPKPPTAAASLHALISPRYNLPLPRSDTNIPAAPLTDRANAPRIKSVGYSPMFTPRGTTTSSDEVKVAAPPISTSDTPTSAGAVANFRLKRLVPAGDNVASAPSPAPSPAAAALTPRVPTREPMPPPAPRPSHATLTTPRGTVVAAPATPAVPIYTAPVISVVKVRV